MPLTKSKAIEAFKHVLCNVFKVPEQGPLLKALESAGYGDIWGLATLSNADIESLTYWDNKKKNIPLGTTHKCLLCIFCHYCDHRNCIGAPIGDDWFAVSADDFNAYRISSDYRPPSTGSVIPPPTTSVLQPAHYSPPHVENTKHGMKQGLSPSVISKDGKNHSPPMTLNRKWAEDVFCHIVMDVFQKTMDSPMVAILEDEGITNVFSMVTLCDQDIADIPLSISDKQLLFIFRSFHLHRQSHGHPVIQMISVMQGEFEDFKEGPNCPVIPRLIMESLPMPAYLLKDPAIMDHPLSSNSQEDMESNDEPANFLLSSSHVESQAVPTLLAPVLLSTDSDTSMTMVVDLTAATLDPVTTSDPCQDHVDDAHDPCINLLGG